MSQERNNDAELRSQQLDEGMRAAFQKRAAIEAPSILTSIEAVSGRVPRVLLRPDGGDRDPVLKPGTEDAPVKRYQVAGELARGGIGVVLKAVDVDLGRDVAIKVLRSDHVGDGGLLQRFVEEAQIGGQLQHPGIVPVYEMGLQAEGRPYFTMKLVKGRTLSALLADRDDCSQQLGRFLSIFEQICQTLSYAHSRGVVHRDLKPSNVMIGAFGEVQVVDWGFAKVLGSGGIEDEKRLSKRSEISVITTVRSEGVDTHSIAGSVMGTPAYMPPEQARGDVEILDERSDVFCLGGILCETLTGEPPYTGPSSELVHRASNADLDEAMERLDTCGADAAIVGLAKHCLAPVRRDRPRNAGAVAKIVGEYLASTEERAMQAELRAAATKTRWRWSVALAIVICIGAWWVDRERGARRAQATRIASESIESAMLALGQARSAGPEDLSRWPETLAAAEEAVANARNADAESQQRANRLLRSATAEAEAASLVAVAARTDREMQLQLTEIRTSREDLLSEKQRSTAFQSAFASYGLAPERIRGSKIKTELIAALDDWGEADALLREVDPDPWRDRLRSADVAELEQYAEDGEFESLPRASILLLGERLGNAGLLDSALKVYHVANDRFSGDFWALWGLGRWCKASGRPEVKAEAVMHFADAAARRPECKATRFYLAKEWSEQKDLERALALMHELYELDREYPLVRDNLATLINEQAEMFYERGAFRSASRAASRSIALAPQRDSLFLLSKAYWRLGRIDEAVTAVRASLREGGRWDARFYLGAYLSQRGDPIQGQLEFDRAVELEESAETRYSMYEWYQLGETLLGAGSVDAAAEAFAMGSRQVNVWSAKEDFYRLAGDLRESAGVDASLKYIQRLADLHPANSFLRDEYGYVLWVEGRVDACKPEFRRAREAYVREIQAKGPGESGMFAQLRYGWSLANCPVWELRDPEKALRLVEEAARRRGNIQHDQGWFLGPVLFRNGRFEEALEQFDAAGSHGVGRWAEVFRVMLYHEMGSPEAEQLWRKVQSDWKESPQLAPALRTLYEECEQVMTGEASIK